MKRTELAPGEQYVNTAGVVFAIEATDPGWRVRGDEWVHEPEVGKRYMPDRKEYAEYKTNGAIRAWRIDHTHKGERTRVAIEPRILVQSRKEWDGQHKDSAQSAKEFLRFAKDINRAAKAKGFPPVIFDASTGLATVPIASPAQSLGVKVPP